jgi:hypothetical protein
VKLSLQRGPKSASPPEMDFAPTTAGSRGARIADRKAASRGPFC